MIDATLKKLRHHLRTAERWIIEKPPTASAIEHLRKHVWDRAQWRRWFQLNAKHHRRFAILRRAVRGTLVDPRVLSLPRFFGSLRRRQPQGHAVKIAPNGLSWRSLKRAVNCGWMPPRPSVEAMARHAWFRKAVFYAAIRIRVGQEGPGDRALVESAAKLAAA